MCFNLLFVQCPENGSLPKTFFLIIIVLWSPGIPAPLATRDGWSRCISCVDCMCSLVLARQLESVGFRANSRPSARKQENALTAHTLKLQDVARKCLNVREGAVECCNHACSQTPAREWGSVAREWENAMTFHARPPQQGVGECYNHPTLSGFSKAVGKCHIHSSQPVL